MKASRRSLHLAVLCCLLAGGALPCAPAHALEPPAVVARQAAGGAHPLQVLQPGEWYEVPDSQMIKVMPKPAPGRGSSRSDGIMSAWSGAAYDTRRDRLVVWGGGHADYAGNELYAFDVEKLKWERLTDPSPTTAFCGPLDHASGQTDPRWNGDGTPVSRHTYDGLQYLPALDRFWAQGGSAWCEGSSDELTWLFDFTSRKWQRRADAPMRSITPVSAYDPVTGHVFQHNQTTLMEYAPASDSWKIRSGTEWQNGENTAELDPVRRRFYVIGNGECFYYDLNSSGKAPRVRITTRGDNEIVNTNAPGLAYDPVTDKLVAWNGASKVRPNKAGKLADSPDWGCAVYTLDLDTLAWSKHVPKGAVRPPASIAARPRGTFGRWQYIPSKNAFIGVNSVYSNVFLYKLPDDVRPGKDAQPVK